MIANGKLELEEFRRGIEFQAELPPGIAPANGLFLHRVYYAEDWQEKMESFGETR
jgi:tRNA U38,U39,U40 pseudouridine synthase TruA